MRVRRVREPAASPWESKRVRAIRETTPSPIGRYSGQNNQGNKAVAVGYAAGLTDQHANSIILNASGVTLDSGGASRFYVKPIRAATEVSNVVTYNATTGEVLDCKGITVSALGHVTAVKFLGDGSELQNLPGAGYNSAVDDVKIGNDAGIGQGSNAVAVGHDAGTTTQGAGSVAVGYLAGNSGQGSNAVAVGNGAAMTSQGDNAVAVGIQAGLTSQGVNTVAVGGNAGKSDQGDNAVAVGVQAGQISQGDNAVAVGWLSGNDTQGDNAVAVGRNAGQSDQEDNAVAVDMMRVRLGREPTPSPWGT